jgi:ABC-type sugar transport system ATPase subunit
VFDLADTVFVLRRGRLVGRRGVTDTTPEEVVAMITGVAGAGVHEYA